MFYIKKKYIFWVLVVLFLLLISTSFFINLKQKSEGDLVSKSPSEVSINPLVSTFEETELPSDFPQNFPIFPKSKLKSVWTSESQEKEGFSLTWETFDGLNEVYFFYKSELVNNGFLITDLKEDKNSYTINFERDSFFGFLGLFRETEDKVIISVTIAERKNDE